MSTELDYTAVRKDRPMTPDEFGTRLEALARDGWRGRGGIRGLSQAVGVSRPTLYAWFRGDSSPTATMLARLAAALDMTAGELVSALESPSAANRRRIREPADSIGPQTRIDSLLGREEIAWCEAGDPIGPVAHRLYDSDYSQIPVRNRGRWMGLLTGETIARWMAGRTERHLTIDEGTPVREVLSYTEDPGHLRIVPGATAVTDVVEMFHQRADQGQPLAAVLVTTHGLDSDELDAIVTPYDLPRLLGATGRWDRSA